MFNMNSALMQNLFKSQLKKLKHLCLELYCEKEKTKTEYQIEDHKILNQEIRLFLKEKGSNNKKQLCIKL